MTPTDPVSPATLPRVNRHGPPALLRGCLESNPAVTLSHSNSTREEFDNDVRFSAVLVFVGYGFLSLMGVGWLVSLLNLDLDGPGALLFLVVLSLIGTGHYVYRKVFETPYNAEERWVWLDWILRHGSCGNLLTDLAGSPRHGLNASTLMDSAWRWTHPFGRTAAILPSTGST